MPIELALTPDGRWEFDADVMAAAAADAGFSAIGMPVTQASPASLQALAVHGLRCHDVLALTVSRNAAATLKYAEKAAQAAAALGAGWVLTVFGVVPDSDSQDLISRCAEIISSAGARMAVEFSPLGPLSSIQAAVQVVDLVGTDQAGVMIDTWHFFRGDSTWEQLEQIPLEKIAYVQFDDAPAAASDDGYDETLNRRLFPGGGVFELERFASTLLQRGWTGVVSVEVLNAEFCRQPVAQFARTAHQTTAPYWL